MIHKKEVLIHKRGIDKLYFIKIKNLCTSNDTNNNVSRQPTEWEKLFATHIFDKVLISRIYKEYL